MATRIWVQKHTVAGRLPELDAAYERHLRAVAAPDTEIHLATLPPAVYSGGLPESTVRFGSVEVLYAQYFAAGALRAQAAGYDGYVIATSQDPGLTEARTLASIPVIGYGETTFSLARMLKYSIGVVGFIPELADPIGANAVASRLDDRLVGFNPLTGGPSMITAALTGEPAPFLDDFREQSRALIARGATAIMPGEGIPNEILVHHGVTEVDGVPVIDCDGLVIKFAELLVDVGRRAIAPVSTHGYWGRRPPPGVLEGMAGVLYADLNEVWGQPHERPSAITEPDASC